MDITFIVKWLIGTFSGQAVTSLVNMLSLISFFLTLFVFINVRRIKKAYISTARVPDLAKRLKQHSTKIIDYLNDFESNHNEIRDELSLTEVTLQSLKDKTNGSIRKSILLLLSQTRSYNKESTDPKILREMYRGMIKLQGEITEQMKDRKWEPPS